MTNAPRAVVGVVVAGAAFAGFAALSQVPYADPRADSAVVRLSWRARGVLAEECRRPSEEELERLPEHMRREEVCEGRLSPFLLTLRVDGNLMVEDTVHGSGAREDRPIYVFREIEVEVGARRVDVRFDRLDGRAENVDEPAPFPARLERSFDLDLEAGQVALITYDEDARALVRR